jgi:hypothetical protein
MNGWPEIFKLRLDGDGLRQRRSRMLLLFCLQMDFLRSTAPIAFGKRQHIAKRLFAESQRLGFYVGVNDALPCVLLHEFDLWRSLDDGPFFGFAEHPPQGTQGVVVI